MGRNQVYNVEEKKTEFLRLFASGKNFSQCCNLIGVSRVTFNRWKKVDHNFNKVIENVKEGRANNILFESIEELGQWHEEKTVETEWLEVDCEGRPVKKKEKVVRKPPSQYALKMLANKYDKTYNDTQSDNSTNITVRITQRDRSLSMEERIKLLEDDAQGSIDAEYKTLSVDE